VQRFNPKPGEVLDHAVYEADKTAIGNALTRRGYLDARLVQARVEVQRAAGTARITLHWQSGERYRIGSVRFSGSPFSEAFLARYLPFELGERYAQTRLLQLQQRLVDSDYFHVVEVGPLLDEAQDGVVPIEVRLEPAKRSVYSGGFAVGTDSGLGLRSGLERRYVNAAGHKLKLEADLAQKQSGFAAGYVIPVLDRRLSSWNLSVGWRDRETASARERLLSAGVRRLTEWEGWQLSWGLNAVSGAFTVADERGDTHLLYGVARIQRRQADDFNAVRSGYLLAAEVRGAASSLGSRASFATMLGEARWIGSYGAGIRLLTRGTLGLTWTDRFERLPPDLRFYAGGDRSLRGYDFQALGPTNASGRVIGGRYLALGSVEVEKTLSEAWAAALFLDAGNAFDAERTLKLGPGLGVRWRSPVGLVRIDLAAAWREAGRPLRLHLVLGPDL
jgi:translocation and assembly module TamA